MGVFLKVFLLIVLYDEVFGGMEQIRVEQNDKKTPEVIRDVIKHFNRKDSSIHDVAIISWESESSDYSIDRIIKEIPEENTLIVSKMSAKIEDIHLRPASFVIILSDRFQMIDLLGNGTQSFELDYFRNTAKIIFVNTKPMIDADIFQLALLFFYLGAFNVIMLDEIDKDLEISSFNPYLGHYAFYSLDNEKDFDNFYPDKLHNMFGHSLAALSFKQRPRFYKGKNGEYHGIDIKLMETIADKQNAQFNITYCAEKSDEHFFLNVYNPKMYQKTVDLTINTAMISTSKYTMNSFKTVNTFDVNGFCALVPYPPRTSFIGQMLTPYDFYTWILFVITIGTCIVIWKLFNLMGNGREDSALYFMYGVIAYFLLQSIPFRNNRIIQRSLLQICIFMMFILGNAYQSLIISLISESRYGATIKTFDGLMQSNYSLKVDQLFFYMINSTDVKGTDKMRIIGNIVNDINYQQDAANNTAIVLRCDVAEYIMYAKEYDSHAIDYFYLLPDQIYTSYESFRTSRFSPYNEKWQYYSSLIFESGIRHYWKEFEKYEDIRGKIETNKITNEEYLINYDDLFGVFYLLGFGFICAILALIFEIFWHDCLRHLNYKMIREFMTKKKEPKMVVRRIQVQPMERIVEEASV